MPVESWDDVADTGLSKENMDDGEYEVQIIKWSSRQIDKPDMKGRVVKLRHRFVSCPPGTNELKYVGQEMDDDRFLTRTVSKSVFFKELQSIGFDVPSWSDDKKGDYPKGTMVPLAIKYAKLKGLTLKLKKYVQNGYANLKFVGRTMENGNPPTTIPNDEVLAVVDIPEGFEDMV
jgi:hypothetical protein